MTRIECSECTNSLDHCICLDGRGPTTRSADGGWSVPCPWCEHPIKDLWDCEWGDGGNETAETWCGGCEKAVVLMQHVSVSYSATRAKGAP